MYMVKQQAKSVHHKAVRFEPDRVVLMVVVLAVITLVLFGALTTL